MGKLDGKVAIITGAASGIGEQGAKLFVENGASVVIADIDGSRGPALAREIGEESSLFVQTDVSDESQVQAAISLTIERFGRLDCLWNNAGAPVQSPSGIAAIPLELYEGVMDKSLRGVFLGIKFAAPIMKEQGFGSIINTASIAGIRTGFATHVYSAAKAAIIQLTQSVAMELGESGIRVNCICPGGVATPFLAKALGLSGEDADRFTEQSKQYLATGQPLKRACLPEDVALAALWLASDAASFVNGHSLIVDGGASCGRMWPEAKETFMAFRSIAGLDTPKQ